MSGSTRIGIYGGTFDPPHLGHLVTASDAHAALGLQRVIFIPAAQPPHKRGLPRTEARLRLEMVAAAIGGDERFEVDGLELERDGASYSIDTIETLAGRWPNAELYLLIGADQAREFAGWRAPARIAELARVVVVARAGDQPVSEMPIAAQALAVTRIDVSSSELRRRAAEGRSLRYLVPDAVREIIARERLYQ